MLLVLRISEVVWGDVVCLSPFVYVYVSLFRYRTLPVKRLYRLSPILISRFLLNLRQVGQSSSVGQTSSSLSSLVHFEIQKLDVVGNMDQPMLLSGDDGDDEDRDVTRELVHVLV